MPHNPQHKKPGEMEIEIIKLILKKPRKISVGAAGPMAVLADIESKRVKSGYYVSLHLLYNIIMDHADDKPNPNTFWKHEHDEYFTSQLTTSDVRSYYDKKVNTPISELDLFNIFQSLQHSDNKDEILNLPHPEENDRFNEYANLSPISVDSD